MIVLDPAGRIIGTTTLNARLDDDCAVSILSNGIFNRVYRTCHIAAPARGPQTYTVAAIILAETDDPADLPAWQPVSQPWQPAVHRGR